MLRSRVRELRRVPASSLLPNPKNWRTHGPRQRAFLSSILDEVGFADALLVVEVEAGLMLVDGHMRAEEAGDSIVPVVVLDLDPAEVDLVLATLDPVAALAGRDSSALDSLLSSVSDLPFSAMLAGVLNPPPVAPSASLNSRFLVPPFSVLDTRQEYWVERVSYWRSVGV